MNCKASSNDLCKRLVGILHTILLLLKKFSSFEIDHLSIHAENFVPQTKLKILERNPGRLQSCPF